MLRKSLLLVALTLGFCLGCSDDDSVVGPGTITGSGALESEERTLGPLNSVSVRMPATVELTYGGEQSLFVNADDNVLQYIETTDSSGTVIIQIRPGISLSEYECTVSLTMTQLTSVASYSTGTISGTNQFESNAINVVLSGSGPITLDLDVQALNTVLSGAGQMTLTGVATVHSTVLSGAGPIRAFDLNTVSSNVVLSGAGDAEVRASTVLNIVLTGAGSVYFKGHPTMQVTDTGPGSVIDAN